MPNNKYTPKMEQLEKSGQFDVDCIPISSKYVAEINPDTFKYQPKNIFYRLFAWICRFICFILGPIVTFFYFGLRIKGRKNLKAIKGKGAILVSNHVHFMDVLYLRQVSYSRPMYYLVATENNKKGIGGLILKSCGALPLTNDFKLAKELDNTISSIVKKHGLITIYAEQSLWLGYTKIRPLKNGAFHYSAKNDVPVLPVVALFRKIRWYDKLIGRKYKVTLQILPPIFPNNELGYKQRLIDMRDKCHSQMISCANAFYGTDCDATHYIEQQETE